MESLDMNSYGHYPFSQTLRMLRMSWTEKNSRPNLGVACLYHGVESCLHEPTRYSCSCTRPTPW